MADGVGEIYHVPKKIGAKIQKLNLKTYLPIIAKVACENRQPLHTTLLSKGLPETFFKLCGINVHYQNGNHLQQFYFFPALYEEH